MRDRQRWVALAVLVAAGTIHAQAAQHQQSRGILHLVCTYPNIYGSGETSVVVDFDKQTLNDIPATITSEQIVSQQNFSSGPPVTTIIDRYTGKAVMSEPPGHSVTGTCRAAEAPKF